MDPEVLAKEVHEMEARGIDVRSRLKVDGRAHLIMPYHIRLDSHREKALGKARIGTTNPRYRSDVRRQGSPGSASGFRISSMRASCEPNWNPRCGRRMRSSRASMMRSLSRWRIWSNVYSLSGSCWSRWVADTGGLLREALSRNEHVLLEGAQAALLDNDFGTYPFVTSSNPSIGGAVVGTGIPPREMGQIVGVTKAYTTRVGDGPFPTELFDEHGETLREAGHEYGSTTGRPRRCGWLDLVAVKYSAQLNGITHLAITLLDVLSAVEKINICVGYEIDGKRVDEYPMHQTDLHHAAPVYKELPGWGVDITGCRMRADLPEVAQDFVEFVEAEIGAPLCMVSVGPERDQAIVERIGA